MTAPVRPTMRTELMSKTAFMYLSTLASAVLGYIALLLATRFVGQTEYGIVAYALSFEGLFLFVADSGFSRSHMKKVSEGEDLKSCFSVYMYVRLILTAVYGALILAGIYFWEAVIGGGYEYPETRTVLLILLAYYLPVSIRWTIVHTYYAQRDVGRAQLIVLSEVGIRAVATVVVAVFEMGVTALAITFAVSGLGSLVIALAISRHLPNLSLTPVDRALLRQYVSFAMPIALSMALGTAALYLDKVLIQWSLDASQTATYFASQRLLVAYSSIGAGIVAIVFPAISQMNVSQSGHRRIFVLTTETFRYLAFIVIPTTALMFVFSGEILEALLSPEFKKGAMAFSLLSVSSGLLTLTVPFSTQALGMGYAVEYARYNNVYSITAILLGVLLIPSDMMSIRLFGLGITGAAIALLVAQVSSTLLFYVNSRRTIGFRFPDGVIRMILASITSCAIALIISRALCMSPLFDLLLLVAIYYSVYLVLALLLRILSYSDLSRPLRTFNIRAILVRKRE